MIEALKTVTGLFVWGTLAIIARAVWFATMAALIAGLKAIGHYIEFGSWPKKNKTGGTNIPQPQRRPQTPGVEK